MGEREAVGAATPQLERHVVVPPLELGKVPEVDHSVSSSGDQMHGNIERREPSSGIGGQDDLVDGLGIRGPRVMDRVGGYLG
jgi:hypothetical protein